LFYSVVFLQELFPMAAALWCCSSDTLLRRFPVIGAAAPMTLSRDPLESTRFNVLSRESSGRSWLSGMHVSVAGKEMLGGSAQCLSQQLLAEKSETGA
jgi:hypothetical protein